MHEVGSKRPSSRGTEGHVVWWIGLICALLAENAPYDDPPEQKGYMTDDEGKISKIKTTTPKIPKIYGNVNNKPTGTRYKLPNTSAWGAGGKVQSATKPKGKKAKKQKTAELKPTSAEKANEQLDMSEECNKKFYKARDGDLKGACPLGPHKEFMKWDTCTCIRGAT
jgi:hypothetical protein